MNARLLDDVLVVTMADGREARYVRGPEVDLDEPAHFVQDGA